MNKKTTPPSSQRVVKMQWVPVDQIEITNTRIKEGKVRAIIKQGIDLDKLKCFPAWRDPETGRFIITDGNHRLTAMKRLGYEKAPIAELTREEFDYIKFSFRAIDLVIVP